MSTSKISSSNNSTLKPLEIEHEEEVENVKENLVLLSDEDYPADFEEDHSKSPEYKRFFEQSQFLQEVNESLVDAPHFLFDKFMSALKVQQENYNGLVHKIDYLEDRLRNQQNSDVLLSKYQELENRVSHLEADINLLKVQQPSSVNSLQMQDAMKKLESICATTVNGVNDVMQYIKSQQSSEINLNQSFDRPMSTQSTSRLNRSRFSVNDDLASHKSELFSDFQSDTNSSKHNVGNDWHSKSPTKPQSRPIVPDQRNVLHNMLQKYILERRQLEDKLLNTSAAHSRQASHAQQLSMLDKTISDIRVQMERL